MTIIGGLLDGDTALIAADGASSVSGLTVGRSTRKILELSSGCLVACAGPSSLIDVVERAGLEAVEPEDLAIALHQELVDLGWHGDGGDEGPSRHLAVLTAYRGRLHLLDVDLAVASEAREPQFFGSGFAVAHGAEHAARRLGASPRRRLYLAIEAAGALAQGCGGEVTIYRSL